MVFSEAAVSCSALVKNDLLDSSSDRKEKKGLCSS
jgi:hypothetical protein